MLRALFHKIVSKNEKRLGVNLDYTHAIVEAGTPLLLRYNKIFGFLDPRKNTPKEAYHVARIVGALSADCGTCVQAEINLALNADVDSLVIESSVSGDRDRLNSTLMAVFDLATSVTRDRQDNPEARNVILEAYGHKGLIELGYAMNGAALLPGIKRSMGYATACDLSVLKMKNGVVA